MIVSPATDLRLPASPLVAAWLPYCHFPERGIERKITNVQKQGRPHTDQIGILPSTGHPLERVTFQTGLVPAPRPELHILAELPQGAGKTSPILVGLCSVAFP